MEDHLPQTKQACNQKQKIIIQRAVHGAEKAEWFINTNNNFTLQKTFEEFLGFTFDKNSSIFPLSSLCWLFFNPRMHIVHTRFQFFLHTYFLKCYLLCNNNLGAILTYKTK